MRGAMPQECLRNSVTVGERLIVGKSGHSITGTGEVETIYALGDPKTNVLVHAAPGTEFRIVGFTEKCPNFTDITRVIGGVWPLLVIGASTYYGHTRNQSELDMPHQLFCLEATLAKFSMVIKPWQFEGVELQVTKVDP